MYRNAHHGHPARTAWSPAGPCPGHRRNRLRAGRGSHPRAGRSSPRDVRRSRPHGAARDRHGSHLHGEVRGPGNHPHGEVHDPGSRRPRDGVRDPGTHPRAAVRDRHAHRRHHEARDHHGTRPHDAARDPGNHPHGGVHDPGTRRLHDEDRNHPHADHRSHPHDEDHDHPCPDRYDVRRLRGAAHGPGNRRPRDGVRDPGTHPHDGRRNRRLRRVGPGPHGRHGSRPHGAARDRHGTRPHGEVRGPGNHPHGEVHDPGSRRPRDGVRDPGTHPRAAVRDRHAHRRHHEARDHHGTRPHDAARDPGNHPHDGVHDPGTRPPRDEDRNHPHADHRSHPHDEDHDHPCPDRYGDRHREVRGHHRRAGGRGCRGSRPHGADPGPDSRLRGAARDHPDRGTYGARRRHGVPGGRPWSRPAWALCRRGCRTATLRRNGTDGPRRSLARGSRSRRSCHLRPSACPRARRPRAVRRPVRYLCSLLVHFVGSPSGLSTTVHRGWSPPTLGLTRRRPPVGVARCASSLASRGTSTSLSNRDIDNAQTRTSKTALPCTSPARNSRALPSISAHSPSNPADICHSPYDGRETHPYERSTPASEICTSTSGFSSWPASTHEELSVAAAR
ncbi:hypothetical protein B0I32_130149 [Nonomuraea fuscirosea]|uniref:Uncharacterized protein n=1 Tax=Nonomuraea fuscirosea TaxID=1291556 RepID=A0A2T0M5Z5_9ACTN|nr:hypothetical protein B0I32_130149 [Nonomuraea fuscirosea]